MSNCRFRNHRKLLVLLLGPLLSSCSFSAQSVDFQKDQAAAERAVSQFHDLCKQGKFEAIYDLMDPAAVADQPRSVVVATFKSTFAALGKTQSSILVEKKVFASPRQEFTSQVKLAYEIKSETEDWTELFVWNIKATGGAALAEYQVVHGNSGSGSPH